MSQNPHNHDPSDSIKSAATELLAAITKIISAGATALETYVGESVKGSGAITDRAYDLQGFTSVTIGSAFRGEITHGDTWSITITADDNVLDKISVTVEEETLNIKIQGWRVNPTQLRVAITMPTIKSLAIGGASNISLRGFPRVLAFAAKAGGASKLTGSISADDLAINASGASTLELEGEANTLTLGASGASHVRLANLPVATAEVALSGASHADINATHSLSVAASGASGLRYGGGATLAKSQLSGNSSVNRK